MASQTEINNILVEKAARKLYLRHDNTTLKEYDIALGSNPTGHKEKEGDGKTPEGTYKISGRNNKSAYHLSLRISYPNEKDIAFAKAHNYSPGGDIMIHGYPNYAPNALFDFIHKHHDWTAGCIAVSDKEIEEIWKLVPNGTSIEIRP